jgi:hypothetical protein
MVPSPVHSQARSGARNLVIADSRASSFTSSFLVRHVKRAVNILTRDLRRCLSNNGVVHERISDSSSRLLPGGQHERWQY